jgi:prepilin-type N-terminal cleavage/methylation domain-containing protein
MKEKARKGFTLVELIVVMAIIAIIAGVSVGAYIGIANKAKKTAAIAEANQIRSQLYAITTESGGYKSGSISEKGVSLPDQIDYLTAELVSSTGERMASGNTSGPSIAFTFYSDAYQNEVPSTDENVRLGIGYLLAVNSGSVNANTVNQYANEVYVTSVDGVFADIYVVKDGAWATSSINGQATAYTGTAPTLVTVHAAPGVPSDTSTEQDASWTNWYANDRYTRFLSKKKAVSSVKDGTSKAFLKDTVYRVGNQNALDLGPHVEAIVNDSPISLSGIDQGKGDHEAVSYALYLASDTEKKTDVKATYIDETTDKPASTGKVKFSDAAAGQSFVLVFRYGNSKNGSFPDVSYDITVVDGYNVTTVYDFFALNNFTSWSGIENGEATSLRNTAIAAYETAHAVPVGKNFNAAVFQSDITISKADLPSYFVWQEGEKSRNTNGTEGAVVDASVVGSLKDETYLVLHRHSKEHPTFDVYGNFFKLSLSADFPKIASDLFNETQMVNPSGKAPTSDHIVESHSSVFSDKQEQYLNLIKDADTLAAYPNFKTSLYDLSSTGNHGVSNLADTSHAGMSFYKAFNTSRVQNCVLTSFYIPAMNNGRYYVLNNTAKGLNPTMTVDSCRLTDSGNTAFFLYNEGEINITDSEVRKAGGPLAINYSESYTLSAKQSSLRKGSWIHFNGSTLENWVTGQGGWFKIHNVENAFAQMKGFDGTFQKLSQPKTFVSKSGANTNVNLICVSMGDKNSNADISYYGGVTVNGMDAIDYEAGRTKMETDLGSGAVASVQQDLYSSDYGAMYITDNATKTPIFKTIKDGTSHFARLYTTDNQNFSLVNPKMYLTQQAADGALDADFGNSDYLSMYYFGTAPKAGGITGDFSTYPSYAGSDAYGILMTLSDYSA